MSRPELCVIFNPTAGRHRAAGRLENLRRDWGARAEFVATRQPGHAVELARQAALDGFSLVAAAGGDGTVHEVANGILLAGRPDVAFAVIPIGSANDYAFSLEHGLTSPAPMHRVDVGVVRTPAGRQRFFVCCLGLGLNGAVTLESRGLDHLQGMALYGLATLRALIRHYRVPLMDIVLDEQAPGEQAPGEQAPGEQAPGEPSGEGSGEPSGVSRLVTWRAPTLMLSVLIGRREGGFVMAPEARLDDGWFDYVHAGALSRWEVLRFLPRLALWGPPANHPKVRQGRGRRLQLRSQAPLIVHVDGEFFCRPEEQVHELDIQLLPAALRVQTNLQGPVFATPASDYATNE